MTLLPNSHPAPRGLTAQLSMSSGSDHIRSRREKKKGSHIRRMWTSGTFVPQNAPSWGISCARDRIRIWSSDRMSGESPPWTHSVVPSIICPPVNEIHTQDLARTYRGQVEIVKHIAARPPHRRAAVLLLAFVCSQSACVRWNPVRPNGWQITYRRTRRPALSACSRGSRAEGSPCPDIAP